MSPIRHISAVFALVAFLGGGLVAPALHRAAHGFEHEHARHAAAAQTDHVHADGTGLTVPLEGLDGAHDLCVLCLPKPSWDPALPAVPSLFAADRSFALHRPVAPATATHALVPIRGPPAVA